jgi:hypothetical protein
MVPVFGISPFELTLSENCGILRSQSDPGIAEKLKPPRAPRQFPERE